MTYKCIMFYVSTNLLFSQICKYGTSRFKRHKNKIVFFFSKTFFYI